jgi:tRNA threonylcarbamoyladenosine modification (KEOPS) complex Cgi121 subunit
VLKYFAEFAKYVKITGFRNVGIEDAEEFVRSVLKETPHDVWVQFFDADLVASWQHLYFALLNALLAFRGERNISRSVAMEAMLYASAQRQIRKAIQRIGVKRASANLAVVIIGESVDSVKAFFSKLSKCAGVEIDEAVLDVSVEKMQDIRLTFGITEKELETVTGKDATERLVNLVIERVALLSTQL